MAVEKAQGNLLHIVIGVLIIASLTMFLFSLQTTHTVEETERYATSQRMFTARLYMSTLSDATYVTEDDERYDLFRTWAEYCFSSELPYPKEREHVNNYIQEYINNTIDTNYSIRFDDHHGCNFKNGELPQEVISVSRNVALHRNPDQIKKIVLEIPRY